MCCIALLFSRPTLSIGYAAKHDELMAEMGMSRYCQPARSLDVDRLIEQFTELESRAAELRSVIDGAQMPLKRGWSSASSRLSPPRSSQTAAGAGVPAGWHRCHKTWTS